MQYLFKLIQGAVKNRKAMKCREVKYYLDDYIGGKLIDEMRKEISFHFKEVPFLQEKGKRNTDDA